MHGRVLGRADNLRYFDKKTIGLDFAGMKEDLEVSEPLAIWHQQKQH
jgi:hypothetical protein